MRYEAESRLLRALERIADALEASNAREARHDAEFAEQQAKQHEEVRFHARTIAEETARAQMLVRQHTRSES